MMLMDKSGICRADGLVPTPTGSQTRHRRIVGALLTPADPIPLLLQALSIQFRRGHV